MSVGKAVAGAGAWAWEQFGEQVKPGFLTFLRRKSEDAKEKNEKLRYADKKWINFSWGPAAERYKKHLQQIYGQIRVIGTTEPIPIGDIFTDVYILEKPQAYNRFDITKLHEAQKEPERFEFGFGDGKRTRGLKIVVNESGHRLYILGKPGAGKTTFMKYLVHQTIIARELEKLPVFITLRDWDARNTNLIDFIAKQFEICNFPDATPFIEYLLEDGYTIFLFDGLDEVPQENNQRDITIQKLHDFSKKYLETQMVITCRVAANDYSFTEFTYIEMADFNDAQIKAYAHNWFRNSREMAVGFLKELNLEENKGVRDLVRSPLLLSMICLAYDETLSIPNRRVELYEEALDALLKKWDSSRKIKRDPSYKQLSLGHKRQMFARIAAEYFEKGEIFFPKRELAKKIENYLASLPPEGQHDSPDGESILETISAQHGILVERAKGIYSFSHLTFQEYYTAKYIASNASRSVLENMTTHLNDTRWKEVFLLTASLLYESTHLFTAMQKGAQDLLKNFPHLVANQTWTTKRATLIPAYKGCAKRILYWYLSRALSLASDRANDRIRDRIRNLDKDFEIDNAEEIERVLTLAVNLDHVYNFGRSLDRNLDRDLDRILNLARNLDQNYIVDLNRARDVIRLPDRSNFFERAHNLNHALAEDLDRNLDIAFDLPYDLAFDLAQSSSSQIYDDLENLLIDFYAISQVFLANIFTLLPQKERTKVRVSKFQSILKGWIQMSAYVSDKNNAFICPSYQAPNEKWQIFRNRIQKAIEDFLEIDLSNTWGTDEYEAARSYLQANKLFWNCLQIARVEDRDEVEDMMFRAPDKNK